MQKKTIKYFTATLLLSSTLFFTGCVPASTLYNHGYSGYSNESPAGRYVGIYDYPRYLDSPYYLYNNRYYYGGYYRNGYYHHRGHRYRHGRYYHRGYRYHHRRHRENVRVLRREDHHRHAYSRDYYDKDKRSRRGSRFERNRNRNVHLLRR